MREDWKKIPITKCGFPYRLVKTLEMLDAKTLGDAAAIGVSKVAREPNCGRHSSFT